MAFALTGLAPIGGNSRRAPAGSGGTGIGAFTLWAYRTEDAAATVDSAGYFNNARSLLTAGDIILRVTVNSSGVVQTAGFHIVNSVPAVGTDVDVADALALTVTDTD